MGFYLYSASVRGPLHIAENIPNQDAVLTRRWNHGWLAVVCDGMGSRKHSDTGARCACKAAHDILQNAPFDRPARELICHIYNQWLKYIGFITPDDAVTTCLIAWGKYSGETRLFQLGDGAILYHGNQMGQLSYRSENQFSNETNGLGVSRQFSDWIVKKIVLLNKNHGLALMTDGISDDLVQSQEFVPYMIETLRKMKKRRIKKWLVNELENWPTPGHTDDKTIAIIYRR